jgi:hypothetical protein
MWCALIQLLGDCFFTIRRKLCLPQNVDWLCQMGGGYGDGGDGGGLGAEDARA